MKKIICAILSLAIVMALSAAAFADGIDLSALTWEELLELKAAITLEQWSRDEWEEVEVPQGVYKVGEDIPAGKWTVTCKYGTSSTISWCEKLDSTGHDVDIWGLYDMANVKNPNHKWTDKNDRLEYTFDAIEGHYIIIDIGTATFAPYTGTQDLGFKKK